MKNQPHKPIRLGFVSLSDCAPIAMARELELFEKYGVAVELSREVGWATVREKIIYREIDAAPAPAPMVVAACLGLGSVQADCVTGLVLNLHGNAITLSNELWKAGVRDGNSLREFIAADRRERTLAFGVVFPYSSHNFILREWLQGHGIVPERDVHIVVVPPPQMPANLKLGNLDGYCVGEPWNSLAVSNKTGWCVATSAEIAPMHPEKVLMVRKDFSVNREPEHLALVAALREACEFCQQSENRRAVMKILASSRFLDLPLNALRMSMEGAFDFGHGRVEKHHDFHIFSGRSANEPDATKTQWVLQHMRSLGMLPNDALLSPDAAGAIFRTDIFHKSTALVDAA